jgi:hypothetical protein
MVLSIESYVLRCYGKWVSSFAHGDKASFLIFLGNSVNRFNVLETKTSATCCLHCVGKHRITTTFTVSFEFERKAFELWEVFE